MNLQQLFERDKQTSKETISEELLAKIKQELLTCCFQRLFTVRAQEDYPYTSTIDAMFKKGGAQFVIEDSNFKYYFPTLAELINGAADVEPVIAIFNSSLSKLNVAGLNISTQLLLKADTQQRSISAINITVAVKNQAALRTGMQYLSSVFQGETPDTDGIRVAIMSNTFADNADAPNQLNMMLERALAICGIDATRPQEAIANLLNTALVFENQNITDEKDQPLEAFSVSDVPLTVSATGSLRLQVSANRSQDRWQKNNKKIVDVNSLIKLLEFLTALNHQASRQVSKEQITNLLKEYAPHAPTLLGMLAIPMMQELSRQEATPKLLGILLALAYALTWEVAYHVGKAKKSQD